jgi:iron complex outermembrane receptor protein
MHKRLCFISFLLLYGFAAQSNAETLRQIPTIAIYTQNAQTASQAADQHPGSPKYQITQHDISNSGETSLSAVLQNLGGIQLQDSSGNGTQTVLSLRGFGSNATSNALVLINGIPITNPDISAPNLNFIPLQEIKYIEIIAGSESVLYGDQAVGGVINIVTDIRTNKAIALSCGAGSYNAHQCEITLGRESGKMRYGLYATTSHTDNYRVHNRYDQNLVSGQIGYRYSSGQMQFNTKVANETMQFPGALTAAQVAEDRRQAANQTNFFRDWNGFFHLNQAQRLSDQWQLKTDLVRRDMHGDGILQSPFSQARMAYFLKPQITGNLSRMQVTSGMDLQNDNYLLDTLFGRTVDHEQQVGVFGLTQIPLSSRWLVSLGLRGSAQRNELHAVTTTDNMNRALASSLGVTVQVSSAAKVYLRRAESFRFPKADENADTPSGTNGLKTQRGVSYESGVNYLYQPFATDFSIYQLNLRDEIAFDPLQTPQNPFGTNTNYNETVRRGFSLSEKFRATHKITLGARYHFVNARFQEGLYAGNRIPLVAENILLANLNYALTDHWNVYTEALYTGSEYSDGDNANVAGTIGGYTTYNFSLRYRYAHFTASFRLNNIFNKYYYLYTVYQPSVTSQFFYPAPGRNLMLNVKYLFS